MIGAFSGAVACFALVGLSFFLIQPFLSQPNLLVTLPFFWACLSSGVVSLPLLGYGFKTLSKTDVKPDDEPCNDGKHCGEKDSKLSSVSSDGDSTEASDREERQSRKFSKDANEQATNDAVSDSVSYDFKNRYPAYFIGHPNTELFIEPDGYEIRDGKIVLKKPAIVYPANPDVSVEPASANEVKKEDVAVKQKERKRSYFLPCERQD